MSCAVAKHWFSSMADEERITSVCAVEHIVYKQKILREIRPSSSRVLWHDATER